MAFQNDPILNGSFQFGLLNTRGKGYRGYTCNIHCSVPCTEGEDEKKDRFQLGAPSGLLRVDQFFGENWIMAVSCFDLRTLYSQTEKKWVHPLATP